MAFRLKNGGATY
jgi:hypothetical protein